MKNRKADFTEQCKKCGSKNLSIDADILRIGDDEDDAHVVCFVASRCNEKGCTSLHYSYTGALPGDNAAYHVRVYAFGRHDMDFAKKPHKWCETRYNAVLSRLDFEENRELQVIEELMQKNMMPSSLLTH